MPFKIFFIIQFQDITSLFLKETIICCKFLKDISIDFWSFFSHCKQKQFWEVTTLQEVSLCNVQYVPKCDHAQGLVMLVCIIWSKRYSSFPHMLCISLPLSITIIRCVYFPICAFYKFSGETFSFTACNLCWLALGPRCTHKNQTGKCAFWFKSDHRIQVLGPHCFLKTTHWNCGNSRCRFKTKLRIEVWAHKPSIFRSRVTLSFYFWQNTILLFKNILEDRKNITDLEKWKVI